MELQKEKDGFIPPVTLTAGCKINLYLRVTGRREDGYHTLESLFIPLPSPTDTLTVSRNSEEGLSFSCSVPALERSPGTVHKAYALYTDASRYRPGLHVRLEKGIPMGTGLGGGSSDAAALLLYLEKLAQEDGRAPLGPERLAGLAARIGADVPFFLHNTPSLVSGIGEKIVATENPFKGSFLLLLCPEIHVSTAWAFATFDEDLRQIAESGLTLSAGKDSTSFVHGVRLQNDLETVVFRKHPKLAELRKSLLAHGAYAARMSGSGASLFGLFTSRREAEDARAATPGVVTYLHEL
ncbi:4-(cytidine 5'-diphospho)-2-C-methyl-D-erythritol kinase [Desulfovibrio sp. OttesenSCG-928-I05]|nr:4-(cytidine 5'-diphospho)-2-C-methyl-D-erythritol kinase [Desulfovibrio sp. OttesenSCG-928-I05]